MKMKGSIHKKDLYKFIVSQPSGFETTSSVAAPFVFEVLLFELVAFLDRFLTGACAELVLRFTPEVVDDLPLVAGDIENYFLAKYVEQIHVLRDSKLQKEWILIPLRGKVRDVGW
jgi:hypothetical protein